MAFLSAVHGDTPKRSSALALAYIGPGAGSIGKIFAPAYWLYIPIHYPNVPPLSWVQHCLQIPSNFLNPN